MLKVNKTDTCWNWTAGLDNAGYGQFSVGRKGYRTHRFSWLMHKGKIPKGLNVNHHCDNPMCVNPDHLFLGTQAKNMKDKTNKGRAQSETRCYNCKLTNEQVALILQDSRIYREIAKEYNVSLSLISKIRCNQSRTLVKIKRIKKISAKGEQTGSSKLTEKQVLAIRADTRNYKQVLEEYGISNSTYYAIRSRQYWKHI